MQSLKYELKWFLQPDNGITLDAFIPIFHRWIQSQRLDDVLIDVADYRHVPNGPGVILIGHDAQYRIDQGDGQLGLLYSRRRETHPSKHGIRSVASRLQSVFHDALWACQQLEAETAFQGRLRFRTDILTLRINDRLRAPSTVDAYCELHQYLKPFLAQLYPASQVTIEHQHDAASRLTAAITSAPAATVDTLLARLTQDSLVVSASS